MPSPARMRLSTALLLAAMGLSLACKDEKSGEALQLPELPDQAALERTKGKGAQLNPVITEFDYLYQDKGDTKRQTRLTAARAEPGAQSTKVLTKPRATIELAPHRVLVLTAAKATFTMPGDHPRDGLFAGTPQEPVVFTLYECEEGKRIELATDAQVRLRVFFDGDTRFDLERDEVQSSAPVQVTGPLMDVCGTGLQLAWNRLEGRMEQLDIRQGQVLCYQTPDKKAGKKADESAPSKSKPLASALEKHQAARSLHTPGANDLVLHWAGPLQLRPVITDADGASNPKTHSKTDAKASITHYHAVLEQTIRGIQHAPEAQDEIRFSGERLDTQFSLSSPQEGKNKAATTLPVAPADSPAEVLGGEDSLTLTGTDGVPAGVQTGKGETISGASLTYTRGSGRVAAKGSAKVPVALRAGEGWLTGTRLDLDPGTGKAFVYGPGQLESAALKQGADAKPGEPLRASYADHLEMDFTVPPTRPGQTQRLGDPVETRLLGEVKASHPDFSLACGRLALGFGKEENPAKGRKARSVLKRVDISQDNPVMALRDPKQGSVTIKSPAMRLTVEQAGDRTLPVGFAASGPVEAVQGDGSTLTCDRLDVDFVPPDAKHPDAKPAVNALYASGDARYKGQADGKPASLSADSFIVNAQKNTLELTGSAARWAALETQGMSLAGEKVFVQKENGIARVAGPGRLTLVTQEKQHLAVTWQGKMAWNDAAGTGLFEKQVDCVADAPDSASTLHADDSLALQVDPGPKAGEKKDKGAKRDLRLADARGKVVFAGSQNDDQGKLARRVRVDGPNLLVTNDATESNPTGAQTIRVTGAGLLLMENFKQGEDQTSGTFSGQGATFFAWKKSMLMDVAHNDLHLLHDVEIRHRILKTDGRYAPEAEDVILTCQETHADLTESGGLGGLHDKKRAKGDQAKIAIRQIKCDHGVAIRRQGERIEADHLLFKGEKQSADLWCDPPRRVELFAKGQDTPAAADRVIWRVDKNQLEVEHPSGGMLPQWK